MLKSCSYCGRIHKDGEACNKKPVKKEAEKKDTEANKFRRTYKWTKKSIEIRSRDNYMCQLCIREFEGTILKYNSDNVQAHHIESIESRPDLKLDNLNLITACKPHHDMAEEGKFPLYELKKIAKEQEDKYAKDIPPIV